MSWKKNFNLNEKIAAQRSKMKRNQIYNEMSYGLYTLYLNLITLIFASAFVCAHILHALLTHTLVAHIRRVCARAPCAPSIIIIIFKFRVIARLNDHFSKKCALGCVLCAWENMCTTACCFLYIRDRRRRIVAHYY